MLACAVGEVTNHALCDPILEMSVKSTEGKPLAVAFACLLECIVGILPIVAVIVLDGDAVLGRILLKRQFGGHGQLCKVINLEVHKAQARVVVHKNGASLVLLLAE